MLCTLDSASAAVQLLGVFRLHVLPGNVLGNETQETKTSRRNRSHLEVQVFPFCI